MKGLWAEFPWRETKFFISHMVQMKGDREFILRAFESTFISHMVQMKGASSNSFSPQSSFFISHMVQMKDRCKTRCLTCFYLYIPHGSDERV